MFMLRYLHMVCVTVRDCDEENVGISQWVVMYEKGWAVMGGQ